MISNYFLLKSTTEFLKLAYHTYISPLQQQSPKSKINSGLNFLIFSYFLSTASRLYKFSMVCADVRTILFMSEKLRQTSRQNAKNTFVCNLQENIIWWDMETEEKFYINWQISPLFCIDIYFSVSKKIILFHFLISKPNTLS